jgi:hypothetical protein
MILGTALAPTTQSTQTAGGLQTAGPDADPAPSIQHVVVIMFENEEIQQVWKSGPYEKYLAATYGNDSAYYAACHGSHPNYVAVIAADTGENCGHEGYINYTTLDSLPEELNGNGLTAVNYVQNLTGAKGGGKQCKDPTNFPADLYLETHVPFIDFAYVTDNHKACYVGVKGINGGLAYLEKPSSFNTSLNGTNMANFSFYTPDLYNDGHTPVGWTNGTSCSDAQDAACTAQADSWLKSFLPPILNGTVYNSAQAKYNIAHTAFIIVWDEADGKIGGNIDNAGFDAGTSQQSTDSAEWCQKNTKAGGNAEDTACGGNVYLAVISPYSMGRSFTTPNSDYSITATVEWLFGLPSLGNPGDSDDVPGYPVLSGLFSFTNNGY